MKKITLILLILLLFSNISKAQLKVFSDGRSKFSNSVSFGNNTSFTTNSSISSQWSFSIFTGSSVGLHQGPNGIVAIKPTGPTSATLHVNGNVLCQSLSQFSDRKVKKDISRIANVSSKIKDINTYRYKYDSDIRITSKYTGEEVSKLATDNKYHFGVMADELEALFPELVEYDDSVELYTVNYVEMIPILLKALQEQQVLLESQMERINVLESILTGPEVNRHTSNYDQEHEINSPSLNQNQPNPFSAETKIVYDLGDAETGSIILFDFQGRQVRTIEIFEKVGSVELSSSELRPGLYYYTLVVGQEVVEVRKMLVVE